MNGYDTIDSGTCPECNGKMRSSPHTENNGFNWYCDQCQLLYRFHDDPGPGAYSTISLKKTIPNKERLEKIARIIETVDNRAMACDGPVPSTMEEMTQEEMSTIYALAKGEDPKWRPGKESFLICSYCGYDQVSLSSKTKSGGVVCPRCKNKQC